MDIHDSDDRLLTVNEVAERLRIHPITVRRHIKAGRLRAVRVGRSVRVRESDAWSIAHDEASEAQLPYRWPPSREDIAKRRRIVDEMRRERARLAPLGMSTVDLIREARKELEDRYRKPPGLDR